MEELLDLVDENDFVIGTCSKEDDAKPGVITRNVIVLLQDSAGNHILQVRSLKRKRYPGSYDFAACGSVKSGESYESAVHRELREEMGVVCLLSPLCKKYREVVANGIKRRHFTMFYHGIYEGQVNPGEEVEGVVKVSTVDLNKMVSAKAAGVEEYLIQEWTIMREFFH